MSGAKTTRLMGAEIEYLGSRDDERFDYVDEYYRDMREVNSILLPGSNILDSLMVLKDIIAKIDEKTAHTIGTNGWVSGYGIAYNGVHLHLSGNIDSIALERNILRLINKYGFSPRTVTSWHIFNRPTKYNFKNKRKHCPIYKTPRQTVEVRILDIEYFTNDNIIKDLAEAIDFAYAGKDTEGDYGWAEKLINIPIENYKDCCKFLDTNMAKWWTKKAAGHYINTNGGYECRFKDLEDWSSRPAEERREESNSDGDSARGPRAGRGIRGRRPTFMSSSDGMRIDSATSGTTSTSGAIDDLESYISRVSGRGDSNA